MENGKKIYAVTEYLYNSKSYNLFGKAFDTKEKAKKFILEHLSTDEIEKNNRCHKRGLITENEYIGNKHNFNIRELDLE